MSKYDSFIKAIKEEGEKGGKETGAARALVPFSEFLSKLAEDAEATTKANLDLQQKITGLTRWLLFLTIVLLLLAIPPALETLVRVFRVLCGVH